MFQEADTQLQATKNEVKKLVCGTIFVAFCEGKELEELLLFIDLQGRIGFP